MPADGWRRVGGRCEVRASSCWVCPAAGVPVAFEVAKALDAPLDVIVVRKLGVPHQPELAFGAIGEDGVRVINDLVVDAAQLSATEMSRVERQERAELERRVDRFRAGRPRIPLAGRTTVIVDDGVATGATAPRRAKSRGHMGQRGSCWPSRWASRIRWPRWPTMPMR